MLISIKSIAIITHVFFLTWLVTTFPMVNRLHQSLRYILLLLLILFMLFIPIYAGFTLVQLCRGILGDLSITTLIILAMLLLKKLYSWPIVPINFAFAWIVVLSGLVLYLSTFGIIKTDIYALGYYPKVLLILFIVAELFLWRVSKLNAWLWLIAAVCFYFKLEESHNLWDYLFDPVLWVIAIAEIIKGRLYRNKFVKGAW